MRNPQLVFCDSFEALNKLYDSGLPKNTKIITKSPMILRSKNAYVQNLEEYADDKYREKFHTQSKILTYEIFNNLKKNKDYFEYRILLAHNFLKFFNKIYFGSLFQDDFFKNEFWVIYPVCEDNHINSAISSEIYSVLENHPLCKKIIINVGVTKERSSRGDSKVSIFSRLRIVGYKGIFWYFLNCIALLYKNNKYKIVIISTNELVRDISFYLLFKKNIKLKYFKDIFKVKKLNLVNNNEILINNINKIIEKVLIKSLSDITSIKTKELLKLFWLKEVDSLINNYEDDKISINNFISKNHINMIFFGYLNMPKGIALHNICTKYNIPLVSCQHGITREIISDPSLKSIGFETSFSDHFFCYNKMTKIITENSQYINSKNKVYSVGLPSDYKNIKSKEIRVNKCCYISTILLSGGKPNFIAPISDIKLVDWESDLVKKVLNNLDYKIDFKPYPAIRYADSDITLKIVKECDNLTIAGSDLDLRYIIKNYGLLITSGATSTLAWCVESNIPLVFINRSGFALNKNIIKEFKKAFFVFDDLDEKWNKELKDFLQNSYMDILELWKKKRNDRLVVIDKYFGDTNINAGLNGANYISKLIKENLIKQKA